MKFIYLFILTGFILSACGSAKKLKVAQIRTINFEYSPGAEINFGSTLEGRIMAIMNNGNELDITNHRKLDFSSSDVVKSGKSFTIVRHPESFNEDRVTVHLVVSDKDESFEKTDTIHMNFFGGLSISAYGARGVDGDDQKDRGSRIILRDGKIGDNGLIGTNGGSAGNFEAYLWKEGELYYVYVKEVNTTHVWKYRTRGTGTIEFAFSGGRGGNGGDGGGGGDGKDGSKDEDGKIKRPGDGGNGGHGGDGGNGGNGGNLSLTIHTSASDITSHLKYDVSGGAGGEGGKAGIGGKAGKALEGQSGGNNGANGIQGRTGNWGADGNVNAVVQDFDPEAFK